MAKDPEALLDTESFNVADTSLTDPSTLVGTSFVAYCLN